MAEDYEGLEGDLMDRLAKAEAATEVKDALVHIGHAQITLLHAIFLEARDGSRLSQLQRTVDRIEHAMVKAVEELREIKEHIHAQRT